MLIIHIGLHKTATSSLQKSVFPHLDGILYLGRNIQSTRSSSDIYHRLCDYCFGLYESSSEEAILRQEIQSFISIHGTLLLSEEWFTADYSGQYEFNGARWQEKLNKLSSVLHGLEHKVLVTLRNPQELIYSQYCEFNKIGIQSSYPSFIAYALESNDSKVLDYEALDLMLNKLFDRVSYLPFDLITQDRGHEYLSDFFGLASTPQLSLDNPTLRTESGALLETESRILKRLVSILPNRLINLLKSNPALSSIANLLSDATRRKTIVGFPNEEEQSLLASRFKSSAAFYLCVCDELEKRHLHPRNSA